MIHWLQRYTAGGIRQYLLCMTMDHALDIGILFVYLAMNVSLDESFRRIYIAD